MITIAVTAGDLQGLAFTCHDYTTEAMQIIKCACPQSSHLCRVAQPSYINDARSSRLTLCTYMRRQCLDSPDTGPWTQMYIVEMRRQRLFFANTEVTLLSFQDLCWREIGGFRGLVSFTQGFPSSGRSLCWVGQSGC